MTTDGGDNALQESTLTEEPVDSTTIEELEFTVRTEFAGVVAEEIVRESMVKLLMILLRVKKILMWEKKILMYFRKNTTDNLLFNEELVELVELVNGDLSSPKPEHTTRGSGRHGAGRTAGRGDAGQNKVPTFRSSWKPTAPLALQRNVNNCSKSLSKHKQRKKILCKPLREQNVWLTTSLLPIYLRFITATASALRCWLLTSVPTPICLCKAFSRKACPGISK